MIRKIPSGYIPATLMERKIMGYTEEATSRFVPFIDKNLSPMRLYLTRDNSTGEIQLSWHWAMRRLPVMKRILWINMWSGGGEDGYIGGHLHEIMFRLLAGYVICDGKHL